MNHFPSPLPASKALWYPGHLPRSPGKNDGPSLGLLLKLELPLSFRITSKSFTWPSHGPVSGQNLDRRMEVVGFLLCARASTNHILHALRPCLSPELTFCSPVPSSQLTTLLLLPPQPNGYQMHLRQSGKETNRQRKHN